MAAQSRDIRIGIVGAGAAGLSLAAHLESEGYRSLTILEREAFPGGKCRSWRRGGKSWELGAILATTDYKATLEMMARTGIGQWRPRNPRKPADPSFIPLGIYPYGCMCPGWVGLGEAAKAIAQIASYSLQARRWNAAYLPGNEGFEGELARPFSEWIERHGMEEFGKLLSIPFTSFGYGYYDEVPAGYVLKYFEPAIARTLVFQGKFFNWKEGVQAIWERLAAGFDVRYSSRIVSVRRREGVQVRLSDGQELEFDRLVLSSPLDEALGFLDASDEETELFNKIRHTDYRVYLCRAEGMRVPGGFAPCRFGCEGAGKPMIWDRRHPDEDIHTFYVLGTGVESEAEIEASVAADVRLLGGTFKETVASVRWKYFPHVGSEDIEGGYYKRLEALQGRRSTYYAGELLSFSTVERTIRYSRSLVDRFFI
jgi:hypothetical protein